MPFKAALPPEWNQFVPLHFSLLMDMNRATMKMTNGSVRPGGYCARQAFKREALHLRCYYHPDREATGQCDRCGDYLCSECARCHEGMQVCGPCHDRLVWHKASLLTRIRSIAGKPRTWYILAVLSAGACCFLMLTFVLLNSKPTFEFFVDIVEVVGPDVAPPAKFYWAAEYAMWTLALCFCASLVFVIIGIILRIRSSRKE